ncbi:hypothetical protein TWF694_011417 [Orbilia ellipsospora]|uniref:CBM1 domain-containing protein n=1 Tax=Orbilia ellipsospora TaxID=2528407 RepID=A0AAV9X583_9PEZI
MLSKLVLIVGALQFSGTLATTTSISPNPNCPTACVDYVNPCGKTYGGCAPHCTGDPLPTFPAPPCSSTTKATTTMKVTTTSAYVTTKVTSSCTKTLCVDYLDACGHMYGGCFPYCDGYTTPVIAPPPCSPTTTKFTPTTTPFTTTPTTSCTKTLCADYLDACGHMYGGCYPVCEGYTTPVFTPPPCSLTTKKTTTPVYTTIGYPPLPQYAQCGGIGWTGVGTCGTGYTCTYYNPYYSQCL